MRWLAASRSSTRSAAGLAAPVPARAPYRPPVASAAVLLSVLLWALATSRATGQGGEVEFAGGHGWAIIDDAAPGAALRESDRYIVMHLPPATSGRQGGGQLGGIVRPAARLHKRPEFIAWINARLYFVMPVETIIVDGRRRLRRMYSMYTEKTIAGTWSYLPADGPAIEPSLPGDGELVGFIGAGGGGSSGPEAATKSVDLGPSPAALIYLGDERSIERGAETAPAESPGPIGASAVPAPGATSTLTPGAWRLIVLAGREWVDVPLPWQHAAPSGESEPAAPATRAVEPSAGSADEARARVHLLPTPSGMGLLVHAPGEPTAQWWTCRIKARGRTDDASWILAAGWVMETLNVKPADSPALAMDHVLCVEGRPMALTVDAGLMTAWLLLPTGPVQVVSKSGVGAGYQVIPRGVSPGVVSVLWPDRKAAPVLSIPPAAAPTQTPPDERSVKTPKGRAEPLSFHLFEFFASGRVLYDGRAKQDGPLTIREVQMIAALLGGVLLVVIVFVLKPEKPPAERLLRALPPGTVPGSAGRRLIASMIDLGLGTLLAKIILGLEWEQVAELVFTGSVREGLSFVALSLLMTWLLPSLGEWQFGRSLGKWTVDCRVVSLRPIAPSASISPAEHAAPVGRSREEHPPHPEPPHGVRLWQAMARNALKWLPPLSLTVLLGPRTRHFADQVAGTIVVEPEPVKADESE